MSKSNFFLKPPVLLAALVFVGLIALSTTLKNQAELPTRAEEKSGQEFEDVGRTDTRINRISAPSVSSRRNSENRQSAAPRKQAPRREVVEDFDQAIKRAEGDASITGIVRGMPAESEAERDARRRRIEQARNNADNDGGDSDRRGPGDWWRERMERIKPVAGAQVSLYEDDPNTTHPALRTTVADENGSFTLPRLNDANQRYILVARAENWAPEATFVSVNKGSRNVDVTLQEGVPLKGKVLDSETSQPVAGAMVYYPNPNWGTFAPLGVTTTTITGEYSFPRVSTGRLLTQASAQGYATARTRLRAPDDDSVIELQPGGASISGVTIDRLTGKPQGGARVWANAGYRISESAISQADGTYTIENLPEGDYTVYAVRGMKTEEQQIELNRNEAKTDIDFVLPASVLVSGQVIHATERKPLEGIKVWFDSNKGSQFRRTNIDGRFAFETMAIDEYAIMIHEKGYLPVGDGKSTDSEEVITRKIASNQASDELVIRLKPVRTLEGSVTRASGGRGGRGGFRGFGGFGDFNNAQANAGEDGQNSGGKIPARDADVKLSYVDGRDFATLNTKTDAAGNFFFNLPGTRRGEGIVIASQNFMLDGKDVRVPRNRPVELTLDRNVAQGQLLLTDESSLDGVSVTASVMIPRQRASGSTAGNTHRVIISQTNTMRGGRLFMGLPPNQDITLTFALPDGAVISKDLKSNNLLRGSSIFIYDPVAQDILVDTARGNRNRRGNGNGNNRRRNNNNQNNNGNQNNGNDGNQPAENNNSVQTLQN